MKPFMTQQKFLRAARLLTEAYLFVICCALPLVFWRKFFDITEAKLTFFLGTSGLYLLLLLLARVYYPYDYSCKPHRLRIHPAVLTLSAFFVCFCIGSALGRHPDDIFWGQNNRYQGLLTMSTYLAVVWVLSRQTLDPAVAERALAMGAIPVALLGVLNHFGVDPFGFYENLRAFDRPRFLSTLGNADFYGSYLCIAFSAVLGWFVRSEKRWERTVSTFALVCVSFGALVAGSDGTALGLLVIALLFPALLFQDKRPLLRFWLAGAIFSLCSLLFGILSRILPSSTYLSSFAQYLCSPVLSTALFALFLLLWALCHRTAAERLSLWKKPYLVTLAVLALLGTVALLLLNTSFRSVSLGGAERYLRFSSSWGTDRGKIWMFAADLYRSYTPAQMLFGAGPGGLFYADAVHPVFSDAALDTAHNEYLQYLLVCGAAGLIGYLSTLALAIRSGLKKSRSSQACRGLAVALLAYAVQASVNIAQPASTPLIFVLIGVLAAVPPVSETQQTQQEESI